MTDVITTELVATAIQSPMLVIVVVAQGFVFSLLFLVLLYRLAGKVGNGFIAATSRQAAAVEKIAEGLSILSGGVDTLKAQATRQEDFTTEMRLSFRAMEQEVKRLGDTIEKAVLR